MTIHGYTLAAFLLTSAATTDAQDLLHYKFEELGGRRVTNYAPPDRRVPRDGTLVSSAGYTPAILWAPGRFGAGALRGVVPGGQTLAVDTGWDGRIEQTAFTLALFVRNRAATAAGSPVFRGGYPAGTSSTWFEGWVGSQSGATRGFTVRGVGRDLLVSQGDVLTPSLTRWVHVALVVQASGAVQFFIDGVPEPAAQVQPPYLTPAPWNFEVGTFSQSDIDEFRFALRAASAAEIQAWASRDLAVDAPFGRGCAPRGFAPELDSNHALAGPPRIGNLAHAYLVFGPPSSVYALAIGLSRTSLAGVPLPLDLGLVLPGLSGCPWESSTDLVLGGALDPAGRGTTPFPIPADPGLVGTVLYGQCLLAHPTVAPAMTTNAFASALGN